MSFWCTVSAVSETAPTSAERVVEVLRRQVTTGEIPPGTRLRQREVAQALGVSTTPVREALATLEREGLVRLEPRRGATVLALSEPDLRDHYEIRIALEELAAHNAARLCSRGDAARLQAVLDEMRGTTDPARYVALNHRFHSELYEIGGNLQLCALIATLRDKDSAYLRLYAARQVPSERLDREHQRILDLCAAGDADGCRQALHEHLVATIDHVTRLLRGRR
jgi:DNA-binding GntR family transcriptional regulator